jgi:hypothetical protein
MGKWRESTHIFALPPSSDRCIFGIDRCARHIPPPIIHNPPLLKARPAHLIIEGFVSRRWSVAAGAENAQSFPAKYFAIFPKSSNWRFKINVLSLKMEQNTVPGRQHSESSASSSSSFGDNAPPLPHVPPMPKDPPKIPPPPSEHPPPYTSVKEFF